MEKNLKKMYRGINKDSFPHNMEISFYDDPANRQTLVFERVEWDIDGERMGLRYGENPCQPAAFYKLVNGNLVIGEVENITPGNYLVSDLELLQSGKHPGKINITDIDNAMNILRYFPEQPCTAIIKHTNPSGVALGDTLLESYEKAYWADSIAAFGCATALNRECDKETAEAIVSTYSEVLAAPEFAPGVLDILAKKKNLRIMKIGNIEKLHSFIGSRFVDYKSLVDGSVIAQWSYQPEIVSAADFKPASTMYKGTQYKVKRSPTEKEAKDLLFGWLVESGITSNSVIYVKDGVTVGIGTGEQDRVGVAEIARDKAYKKLAEKYALQSFSSPFFDLDEEKKAGIMERVKEERGGLKNSVMVSDAFFPKCDGIEVGLREGVTAIVQPGGALKDHEVIEKCNEYDASMVFTGQRSFKH